MAAAAAAAAAAATLDRSYHSNAQVQGSAVQACLHLLQRAAAEAPLPAAGAPLSVAEWGCASGANSAQPLRVLLDGLAQRAQQPIEVASLHSDLAGTDWAALASTLQDASAVAGELPGVTLFPAMAQRSMYERLAPADSIDIGLSFSALHWQPSKVLRLSRTISPGCSTTPPEERAALADAGVANLKKFLALRAVEVRPGGLLVLSYVALDDEGTTHHDLAQAVAEGMVADGLLRAEELGGMSAPVCFLPLALQRERVYGSAAVAGAWEVHLDCASIGLPQWDALQRGELSAAEWGEAVARFFAAVLRPWIVRGLEADGRQPDEAQALAAAFFDRMRQTCAARPRAVTVPVVRALLRRRG